MVGFAALHAATGAAGGMAGDAATQGVELAFGLRGSDEHRGFSLRQMFAAGAGGMAGGALGYKVQRAMMKACFTGRMPMRTPTGHVLAADVRAGMMLNSRDEHDPEGLVVARTVEEVFERFGPVWLLRANGRDIETTPEHPFFVAGKGWTPLNQVRAGDVVRLEDGWAAVEAVEDTGSWQTVYNFRIADDHTYFAGCDEWGFAVWVHNEYGDFAEALGLARNDMSLHDVYLRYARMLGQPNLTATQIQQLAQGFFGNRDVILAAQTTKSPKQRCLTSQIGCVGGFAGRHCTSADTQNHGSASNLDG